MSASGAKKTARVSVVIPCYNGEQFIADAIECVRAQSVQDVEIVVVDDGSLDRSQLIVRELAADPRVKPIVHNENKGIAAARNTGIKASTGKYIAFLDQDDLWRPDKLERQLDLFERASDPRLGLVYSDREIHRRGIWYQKRRDRSVPEGINQANRREFLAALMMNNFIPTVSVLFKRECIEHVGFLDESIRSGADDYEFFVRMALEYRFWHIREPLVVRREHGKNYANLERLVPDDLKIVERIVAEEPDLAPLRNRRESELFYKLGRALHSRGERERARKAYSESLRMQQDNVKPRIALAALNMGPVGDGLFGAWSGLRALFGRK